MTINSYTLFETEEALMNLLARQEIDIKITKIVAESNFVQPEDSPKVTYAPQEFKIVSLNNIEYS